MVLKRDYEKKEVVKAIAEMWAPLTQAEKQVLLHDIHIKNFKKNHFIYKASDLPTRMMVLIQGKVKIYKLGRNEEVKSYEPSNPWNFLALELTLPMSYIRQKRWRLRMQRLLFSIPRRLLN